MRSSSLSMQALTVLSALLDPQDGPHHGYELMRITKLKSGTLYPMLSRFEAQGLVTSTWEQIDEQAEGRPARRQFRLTPLGVTTARRELAQAQTALTPGGLRHA